MTRKELSEIYYINREIEMWKRELDDITGLQSPRLDGLPRGGETSDATAAKAVRAAQISETIDGLLARLQLKRKEIYDYIATIDDSLMRPDNHVPLSVALYLGGDGSIRRRK